MEGVKGKDPLATLMQRAKEELKAADALIYKLGATRLGSASESQILKGRIEEVGLMWSALTTTADEVRQQGNVKGADRALLDLYKRLGTLEWVQELGEARLHLGTNYHSSRRVFFRDKEADAQLMGQATYDRLLLALLATNFNEPAPFERVAQLQGVLATLMNEGDLTVTPLQSLLAVKSPPEWLVGYVDVQLHRLILERKLIAAYGTNPAKWPVQPLQQLKFAEAYLNIMASQIVRGAAEMTNQALKDAHGQVTEGNLLTLGPARTAAISPILSPHLGWLIAAHSHLPPKTEGARHLNQQILLCRYALYEGREDLASGWRKELEETGYRFLHPFSLLQVRVPDSQAAINLGLLKTQIAPTKG